MRLAQGHDEELRAFAARVQGKAETCNFTTVCRANADYTEYIIKYGILAGISDIYIRRETLSTGDILIMTIEVRPWILNIEYLRAMYKVFNSLLNVDRTWVVNGKAFK